MSDAIQSLLAYRQLIYNLAVRDLRLKYKRSYVGVAWSLLNPLFMTLIYTIAMSFLLRGAKVPGRPYFALILSGNLAWSLFTTSATGSAVSFVHSGNLISRVHFPVESMPIAGVMANFVNYLITLVIYFVAVLVARVPLGPSLVLLPVVVLAQLAFCIGLSLLVATLTVYLRDLEHLVGIAMTALFYLSPVLYTLRPHYLPHAALQVLPILKLNPFAWYLETYHSIMYFGDWPSPTMFVAVLVSAVIMPVVGYTVFLRLRARLPEEV